MMLKATLFLVIIGVLFEGARSDFQCFGDKLKDKLKDGVFDHRTTLCRDVSGLVDQLLKYGEECSYAFDGDKVKTVLSEFCNDDSELFKSIQENEECLVNQMAFAGCGQLFFPDSRLSAVENCQRLTTSLSACFEEKVGRPCGERALQGVRSLFGVVRAMVVCDEFESSAEQYRRIKWYILLGIGVPSILCVVLVKLCKTNENKRKVTRVLITAKPI